MSDEYNVEVKKIEEKEVNSKNVTDERVYKMTLGSLEGGHPKVTISQEKPFVGYRPGAEVVIQIKNPQRTLEQSIPYPKEKDAPEKAEDKDDKDKKTVKKKAKK